MRIDRTITAGSRSMCGVDVQQEGLFSYLSPETRIHKKHPLRPVREMVNKALTELSTQFEAAYADTGHPSIAPEKLLRSSLLQIFYSIRQATAGYQMAGIQALFDRIPNKLRINHIFEITQFLNTSFSA